MGSVSMRGAAGLVMLLLVIVGASSMVEAACQRDITPMYPCAPAVTKNGSPPDSQCCGNLKSLGIDCICATLTQYASSLPGTVDVETALTLPRECQVPVSSDYSCAGYTVPPYP